MVGTGAFTWSSATGAALCRGAGTCGYDACANGGTTVVAANAIAVAASAEGRSTRRTPLAVVGLFVVGLFKGLSPCFQIKTTYAVAI